MECYLIGLLDTSPRRESLRNPGDMNSGGCEQLGKIVRGCLSLDIDPQSQDYFGRTLCTHSLDEFGNAKLFGTNPVKRGEFSSESMVASPENPCPLQRQNIGGGLHNAEFPTGTRLITTEQTLVLLGKKPTKTAAFQILTSLADGGKQLLGLGIG